MDVSEVFGECANIGMSSCLRGNGDIEPEEITLYPLPKVQTGGDIFHREWKWWFYPALKTWSFLPSSAMV